MGQYINGMKEEVKAEYGYSIPLTLEQTMEVATRVQERNKVYGVSSGWEELARLDPVHSRYTVTSLWVHSHLIRVWTQHNKQSQEEVWATFPLLISPIPKHPTRLDPYPTQDPKLQ